MSGGFAAAALAGGVAPGKSNPLVKKFVQENERPLTISHINFGLLNQVDMMKLAVTQVYSRDLFELPSRKPAKDGVLDPRLGISNKTDSCQTCGHKLADCAGHFGYIKLELPVFHIGYFKATLEILQTICKTCSRVLLPMDERDVFLKRMHDPRSDALKLASLRKKILERCKRQTLCPYCGDVNGVVKKIPHAHTLKLNHEKYRSKASQDLRQVFLSQFHAAKAANKELQQALPKAQDDLTPLVVKKLFENIPNEDCDLLWSEPELGRPERLLMDAILVPPVCIRPSVAMDTGDGSNEDDLTVKLQEIIQVNFALKTALSKGAPLKMVMEDWDFLQVQVAQYINGDMPGLPKQLGVKPIRGLCQRLKGKQGRFRGNLSGKRVDFSARTVISPDPNLRVDQVGVPQHVAKVMTYPEKVNRYNLDKLRKCVINGPDVHPGANLIRLEGSGYTKNLMYGDRCRLAEELKIGDVVERHMEDDDIVLFNRQPSLHKMSIMSHRVRVMPWRTFRFNECVCAPYNADFDGDEMNMHLPQTEEARAEATMLMGVQHNLITPRNGEPLVAATQDFLTASYLLTQKNMFFNKEQFCQILCMMDDAGEHIDLPQPAIILPIELWTGKQVINALIRPNRNTRVFVNLELKERNYSTNMHMCQNDGYVCIQNSELLSGNLCKKTLGDGTKSGLFYVLIRDSGSHEATRCMNRLAKLCARFLGHKKGFSIGIDDVTPSNDLSDKKQKLLNDGYTRANAAIENFRKGKLDLKAGCNAIQSLESDLNGLLGKLRETAGKECMKALPFHNNPRIMAECGSKGSPLNISQMVACVGQQSVGGKRIAEGFVNRTLPHFLPYALHAAAKGFVANSFYTGLTATEFFFHTMGGREGLVDTAVKTAETGYMARRLMKALEDLSAQYDKTVRNSEGCIVQFTYGDDGLNPGFMEGGDRPVNFVRLMLRSRAILPDKDSFPLTPTQIRKMGKETLERSELQNLLPQGRRFLTEIQEFFESTAEEIESLLRLTGLDTILPKVKEEKVLKASPTQKSKSNRRLKKVISTVDNEDEENVFGDYTHVGTLSWYKNKLKEDAGLQKWKKAAILENSKESKELAALLTTNIRRATRKQLENVVNEALQKYYRSITEPGEAVGAIGAQSISEPGTQMTLKTFHFAGVASMNVTLGVPRLKEIINASKKISTPIITASLVCKNDERSARIVKGRVEKTTLGEVAVHIKEVFAPDQAFLSVKIDIEAIEQLHLNINASTVRHSILCGHGAAPRSVIKLLKDEHVLLNASCPSEIRILPPSKYKAQHGDSRGAYFAIQALKAALPGVIVQGVQSVSRAVINHEEGKDASGNPSFHLLVEGYGLEYVMGIPGVDGLNTRSNHIIEVQNVLGIEAAREMIISEISYIVGAYGISIDRRHLMLLADIMTFKGEILGITRFGIARMRESVLTLASFEKTADHLFDAAVHSRSDAIVGVSECIIMGIPVPIGTGLFKLLREVEKPTITQRIPLLQ